MFEIRRITIAKPGYLGKNPVGISQMRMDRNKEKLLIFYPMGDRGSVFH